ncbi:glycosyl hydrolase family 17 [Piscirickettsia salmonis]|uniref:glycosyl hydrolase family 17 n=1 Tax=Piscirickettsia salmonis TaxID=1238 RepID=UPI000F07AA9F|nr:glycosyl hydrolase family 17 [Piscirickettsiaceae bacterium NZ-RLO2]
MKKNHHFKKIMSHLVITLSLTAAASYAAIYNPTNSNLSVTYGPCHSGNEKELKKLHQYFNVFRLYKFDQTSLDFAKKHSMQVLLGTTNSLAKSFATSNQNHATNISDYLQKISNYLSSATVKVIILGNEPLNQPLFANPTGGPDMQSAINNLYSALKKQGYTLPVTINVADDTYWGGAFDPRLNNNILPAINQQTHPIFYVDLYPLFANNNTDAYRLDANKLLNDMYMGGTSNTGWIPAMQKKFPNISVLIAETGWASAGGNPPSGAVASQANESTYINSVATWAKNNHYPTTLFMMYDRPSCKGTNWEGHFGLMKDASTSKQHVTIPSGK